MNCSILKMPFILIASATVGFATPTPREIVAATLVLEAGGEKNPVKAMSAVHEVIVNRSLKSGKPRSAECLKKFQFSCWNSKNVENTVKKAKNHPAFKKALVIVDSPRTDYTKGGTFYHTTAISPYWAQEYEVTVTVGNHIFYKN